MRRPQPTRNQPNRHRTPLVPLGQIAKSLRASVEATSNRAERIELWRTSDRDQGERPDYLLWRHLLCRECQPEKRRDVVELALGALRARDSQIHWSGVGLIISAILYDGGRVVLREEAKQRVRSALQTSLAERREAPQHSAHSISLLRWWASVVQEPAPSPEVQTSVLQALITDMNPGWRLGRPFTFGALEEENLLPMRLSLVVHTTARLLCSLLDGWSLESPRSAMQSLADWRLVLWQMMGTAHRSGRPVDEAESLALLDASQAARLAGDPIHAARLAALALQLAGALPQLGETAKQRFKVAAWLVAEAGLELPDRFRVKLDDLPFPGDSPTTVVGQETARLFEDPADVFSAALRSEVERDADWRRVADAGQALYHPLPALGWMGKRARSIAMKKSTDPLEAATRLALRHGCLGTAVRLLQECSRPDLLVETAKVMRDQLRRIPFLRDAGAWSEWASLLRLAWGKMENDAIHEAEDLFLLHEVLSDRPATAVRSLPAELRTIALRHPWGRRPSRLCEALAADIGLMRSLEHQRPLEHWALAADARSRSDLLRIAWISLVTRGDPTAGKYSLLVVGPQGQILRRDRFSSSSVSQEVASQSELAKVVMDCVAQVCPDAEWLLLAQDETFLGVPWLTLLKQMGARFVPALIPSWEWASRVMIKTTSEPVSAGVEVLGAGQIALTSSQLQMWVSARVSGCALISTHEVNASTKWTVIGDEAEGTSSQKRSTHVGQQRLVLASFPCGDLVRSCLSQSTVCFVEARSPLAAPDALYAAGVDAGTLHRALLDDSRLDDVTLHGIPWLGLSAPIGAPPPR